MGGTDERQLLAHLPLLITFRTKTEINITHLNSHVSDDIDVGYLFQPTVSIGIPIGEWMDECINI